MRARSTRCSAASSARPRCSAVCGLALLARRRRALRRSDDFETALLDARAAASSPLAWRLPAPGDINDVVELDRAHTDDRALTSNGFRRLGEIVAVGHARNVVRGYVDAAGTTIAVLLVASGQAYVDLRSFATNGARFTTIRGRRARLALPPDVHVAENDAEMIVPTLMVQHRTAIKAESLLAVASIDALLERVAAGHDAARAWRDSVPPDELLEADLRALLRSRYARLGPIWLHRLRSRIPTATVHRDGPIATSRF
ncbi:MAG TPA: hypothetical protein VH143_06750 [Kofleriaceae bacterium]|nr:hypothetical protein [Kofleriaceae bacterium]